ncbi:MAG: glycosyltransferase [Candidatus Aenigmarchaeota archaeon]|nr:glycosyltransferase [Candidatus Aenigmarchaeota archaeon]
MKISVVIPTLNEEKYIDSMLFHVKKLKPYEIIVADSLSKDKTRQIAKKYGAKVIMCPRKNAALGRNAGGRKARGDVILFLDADSIVFPNILEVLEKDFKDKNIVGWTCSIYGFTPKWSEQLLYNMSNQLINFLTMRMKKPHAAGICIAVRRDIFNKLNGFNESLKVMEDHDFAQRTKKYGDFIFSKETCVFTSARRIENWGGLTLIKKYSKIYISFMLNKNKDYQNVEYEPIR